MIQDSDLALISYPTIAIGLVGLFFCLARDIYNIKKGLGRSENTAPEIYWFMMVLVVVGLYFGFEWKIAFVSSALIILSLHPIRKRTKLIRLTDDSDS
ncbi:MAG: hypothetical protein CME70_02010 [Halobacteriovorax sp.]|nr:hypothetical protein [Halobacteriovorax sp.]